MASNEHAYLSEPNLHNPKGLSLAKNNTLCSKTVDGLLEWVSKSYIKTDKVNMSSFCLTTNNYQYPVSFILSRHAPFEIRSDYGSATISSATTVPTSDFFRAGGFISSQAGEVNRCVLQITNETSSNPFVVALVKWTPSTATTSYPVVLFEKEVQGVSNKDKIVSYAPNIATDFLNTSISEGDHIFLMIKGVSIEGEGDSVVANLNVEIGYNDN